MGDLTTLENVKQYLNITTSNSDALLSRLITAQSQWFENQVQRKIARTTYTETLNGNDERIVNKSYINPWLYGPSYGGFTIGARGFAVTLKNIPVLPLKVDGVTDSIVVTIDGGDGTGKVPLTPVPKATLLGQVGQTDGWVFHDDTGKLELVGYRFTTGVNNVAIQYDAGWDATPTDVEQAVIELVSYRYRERDRLGLASKTVQGETVTFSRDAAPMSAQAVIDSYRLVKDG